MIASPQQPHLTPEEYLQMEAKSPVKHEYIDGQIYAIAGASDPHVTVAGNLFALLRSHVRGSGCRVYISDMKAQIEALNRFLRTFEYKNLHNNFLPFPKIPLVPA